jgi:hypothetical protein
MPAQIHIVAPYPSTPDLRPASLTNRGTKVDAKSRAKKSTKLDPASTNTR